MWTNTETPSDEEPEFMCEGWFTHYICPDCGHNDWEEGDLRGDVVECDACGLKGRISQ